MNNKNTNTITRPNLNPELEKKFYTISNLIKSTFQSDLLEFKQLALALVFIKRLIDIEYFKEKEVNLIYKSIRNQIIHNVSGAGDALKKLFSIIRSANPVFSQILPPINLNFASISNSIKLENLIAILDQNPFDFNHYSEYEFGKAFNWLIEVTKERQGSEYLTPEIVKKIMVELLDIQSPCLIYDPAVGVGGFFVEVRNYLDSQGIDYSRVHFTGQEKNEQIFSLFVMNMIMNGIYKIETLLGDTIMNPQNIFGNSLIKYDRIISDPPFGMSNFAYDDIYKNDRFFRFQDGIPGKNSSFGFVQHILASLKNTGKAVVLLNQSVLFSGGSDFEIRKSLIDKDLFEYIVKLPSGILDFTLVEPIIVVFNYSKHSERKNKIQYINLSKQFTSDELVNSNITNLIKQFSAIENDAKLSYVVTIDQIVDNNYKLNVEYYSKDYTRIQDLLEQRQAVRLEEIAEIVRGTRPAASNSMLPFLKGYIVTTKDLNREITSKYLETKLMKEEDVRGREITNRCILISLVGNDLKPTIYDPLKDSNQSMHFIIGNNIIALYPNEEIIRLEYLYYQLYSSEIQKQISVLRKGVIPNFSMAQIRDLVIPIPSFGDAESSLREQDIFINQQTQNLFELEELRFKEKIKELDINKAATEIESTTIRTLAHNILPIVTTSSMVLIRLKKYLSENNLIDNLLITLNSNDLDPEMKEHLTLQEPFQSVKQIIDSLADNLEHMENVITKTRDVITQSIKEEDFEICNFHHIMEDFVDQKKIEYQDLFEIRLQCPTNIKVRISRTHFIEVLNNLLRNAKTHAFDFQEKHSKRLVEFYIEQIEEVDQILFTYKNNGRKLEISEQEYFQALKKSKHSEGFGLGGFFIKTIIQQMNGKINLVKREKGFEMKINFPIPKNQNRIINGN